MASIRPGQFGAGCSEEWVADRDLGCHEVRVYVGSVPAHTPYRGVLREMLDASERRHVGQLAFDRDRARYEIAHGLLRVVLGKHLGKPPVTLAFAIGEHGKPRIENTYRGALDLSFNMSHTRDLVAVAVTRGRRVGVDIEQWVPAVDYNDLARCFFSPAEQAELLALRPCLRMPGFFACWTRKEAYVKALGLGLSAGLDYFDVGVDPLQRAPPITDRRAGLREKWLVRDLALPAGYSGAVACAGLGWQLRLFCTRLQGRGAYALKSELSG